MLLNKIPVSNLEVTGNRLLLKKELDNSGDNFVKNEGSKLYALKETAKQNIPDVVWEIEKVGPEYTGSGSPGDFAIFQQYSVFRFSVDDMEYIIISENEVIGIVRG